MVWARITVALPLVSCAFSVQRKLSSDRDHRGSETKSAHQSSQQPVLRFPVFTEEVLTYICAIFGFEGLVVAVNGFCSSAGSVYRWCLYAAAHPNDRPHDFDNVPASAREDAFQFVNNLAVTGYRAVKTLQVTVDNKDRVVQFSRVAMVIAPLILAHPSRRRPGRRKRFV